MPEPEDDDSFLDRFQKEPTKPRVVASVYPALDEDEDDTTSERGPSDEERRAARERRWFRWGLVALIWLVAIMLVTSFLIRAF